MQQSVAIAKTSRPRLEDHVLLTFAPRATPTPETVRIGAIRAAADAGSAFAQRFSSNPEYQVKSVFDQALAIELDRHTRNAACEGSELLLKIAFLTRATETVRDPEIHKIDGYRAHTVSIMAQHAITRAWLMVPRTMAQELWDCYRVIGIDRTEWRKTLAGAVRVAGVARRLGTDVFGWPRPVYLPTVDQDRAKIDLLVTNGLGQGVTLQVKSVDDDGLRLVKILDEPWGGVMKAAVLAPNGILGQDERHRCDDYGLSRQLWLATQGFNSDYGLQFEPMLAYAGRITIP